MKLKKYLCLLLLVVMIIAVPTPLFAETGISEQNTKSDENAQPSEENDIFTDIISQGIGSAQEYLREQLASLHNDGGVTYGYEWYIITMLRGGKSIDSSVLEEYYSSVAETVKGWDEEVKPTDAEKTALALAVMGKDITDIDGVNLIDIICNSEKLDEGANALAYALIAIYASGKEIPEDAKWNTDSMINALLEFRTAEGGFGLYDNNTSDVDMTAICVQALSLYRGAENTDNAIAGAVGYLSGIVSENWDFSDDPNSAAQVLIALATLGIDVTDSSNGFGVDEHNNIITALEKYRSTDANGYIYGSSVNPMTTVQVMQAYDAYRKAHKEGIIYWNFAADGQIYDDEALDDDASDNEEPEQEENAAAPVDVYVTIADEGKIVSDKNGGYAAQAKVTVSDIDKNGILTVDEALYAAHEEYYDGGAQKGYASQGTAYGLSLAKLWGKGSAEEPTAAGYYINNASCLSLGDAVKEGDYITAFNYCDTTFWSDAYSYFGENTVECKKGTSATLTLNMLGYDSNWNTVSSPCPDAKVAFIGSNNSSQKILTTSKDGKVKIRFTRSASIGTYYVMAYKEDNSIVPAVCRINVTKASSGGTENNDPEDISVYIKVADPKGETYFKKKSFSVEEGTTAYELLMETGLNVDVAKSAYGSYVNAIEGLAEFDEGPESGWMYRVNGKFYNYSASQYSLSDGDYVEWLYSRNMGKDIGDKSYRGTSSKNKEKQEEKTKDENGKTDEKEAVEKPVFDENTYKDVKRDDWHYEAVKYVYENSIMHGTEKGFEPESTMTRAMLVTVLWRLEKEPESENLISFTDVESDEWYTKAVCWAAGENIVSGIDSGLFGTNEEITREQMVTILYRYLKKKNIEPKSDISLELKDYSDKEKISEYAVAPMKWAIQSGIIKGESGKKIVPLGSATRAEIATMIMRFCEGVLK